MSTMISPGHFLQQLPVAQKINLKLPDQTNRASHRRTCLPLQPHCLGEFGRRNVCGTLFLTNGHPHTIPAHAQSTAFFPLPKPHPFAWPSNSQFSCRFSQGTSLESSSSSSLSSSLSFSPLSLLPPPPSSLLLLSSPFYRQGS